MKTKLCLTILLSFIPAEAGFGFTELRFASVRRKLLNFCLLSFVFCLGTAQVPQGFNYQAIARDGSGNPIINTGLPVTITIKTDSTAGIIIWEELHPSVTTNSFGLFTLVVGNGSRLASSNVASFKDIDWSVTPKFIKTQILYQSQLLDMGTTRFWSVPYSMAAGNLTGPVDKLNVVGKTDMMDEALFEVKNKDGQTVFAVYNEGVRVYVADGAKGNTKGGFAIGGFGADKGISQNYLTVSRDSIRAYVNDTVAKGVTKGGFAIGGFGTAKGTVQEYLRVTPDSTRIYVDNTNSKGVTKGGFAIGGFDQAKGGLEEYLRVTSDSVKVSKSLLIPRLTTYERDHLPFIPGDALIIFNTTEGCMQIYKNNVWSNIWCFNCAPSFIIQPVDNTICSGNNVTFFVSATGTSLSYQWQVSSDNGNSWNNISNGGSSPLIAGANGYSLSLANVPVGYHNYKLRCVVAGSCLPNVISNAVTLNVGSAPPVITSQPINQQLSGSCTVSFSIVSPGYGVIYKWQQSIDGGSTWTNISNGGSSPVFSGATTTTLSLSNVPMAYNNNKYRCIVGNSCGTDATSNAATLTIATTTIVSQPTNQQLTTDCNATFSITTPVGYVASYQWQASSDGGGTWSDISNGGTSPVYSGVNTSTLFLSNVPKSYINYQYRCAVSSLCGPNETSTSAVLSLNSSPIITIQPVNKLVYEGQNIILDITTSGSGISYLWQESSDGGTSWSDLTDGGTNPAYTGVTTASLVISNVPITSDNYKYRCKVSHYCRADEISGSVSLSVGTAVPVSDNDGNTYNTVGIGSQLWMAENLKTTKYGNGELIGTTTPATLVITTETDPKYQWAYSGDEANVAIYGRLYTWYAATDSRSLCPAGWHLPSADEWNILANYLSNNGYNFGLSPNDISKSLASTSLWDDCGQVGSTGNDQASNNSSGFNAFPSGERVHSGTFFLKGYTATWWTSTMGAGTSSWVRWISTVYPFLCDYNTQYRMNGNSVRCVKDQAK